MGTEEACADDELVVKKEKSISISKVVPLPQSSSSSSSPPAADHHIPDSNPIGPPTPDFNRELIKGLLLLDHGFSSTTVCNHTDGNGSETPPKETLFDSFAPGADNLMLAPPPPPHHRKYTERELRIKHVVRRQLNFMCETNLIRDITTTTTTTSHMDSDMEHDHLFQIVYGTILDAIVSDHETKKEVRGGFESGFDGFGTPVPHLLLCGIAETCPRAPIKSTNKYRNNIDKEICKKLEF